MIRVRGGLGMSGTEFSRRRARSVLSMFVKSPVR